MDHYQIEQDEIILLQDEDTQLSRLESARRSSLEDNTHEDLSVAEISQTYSRQEILNNSRKDVEANCLNQHHENAELGRLKPTVLAASISSGDRDFEKESLQRSVEDKTKEIHQLHQKINKILDLKNVIESESKKKDRELKELDQKYQLQNRELMEVKKLHQSSAKEIHVLKSKIKSRPTNKDIRNEANCLNIMQMRIDVLESQLNSERLINQKLQELRLYETQSPVSNRNSNQYLLLQMYMNLQKQFKKKIVELNETESLLREKEKELTDDDSSNSQVVQTLVENIKKIRRQERDIKLLRDQVKMYSSLIAAYRDEACRLNRIIIEKEVPVKLKAKTQMMKCDL